MALAISATAVIVACAVYRSSAIADQPAHTNIVLILADDLGYADLGCYDAPDAKTPHLDRLAAEGVRFTQYYAGGAECTPTRTSLLTGAYPQRVGGLECAIGTHNVGRYDDAVRLAAKHELGLPAKDAVLAAPLKQAGYATAVIGKWHLGYDDHFNPLNYGFDHFFGILGGNADYYRHTENDGWPVLAQGRKLVDRPGYMTHLFTDDALQWYQKQESRPRFLYLAHAAPHFPFQAPGNDPGKLTPTEAWTSGSRETYVKMIEDMDAQIGRLLKLIEERGETNDTLVIFASDHGAMKPGLNTPLTGYKGGLMEGGIRAPLIIRWPGKIRPGIVAKQPAITMDLTRSILRVAGASPPTGSPLDGIDLLQQLQSEASAPPRTLFWRARREDRTWRAVRDGDMKYVSKTEGDQTEEWVFDLAKDVGEQQNLLATKPDVTRRLKQKLAAWEREVQPRR